MKYLIFTLLTMHAVPAEAGPLSRLFSRKSSRSHAAAPAAKAEAKPRASCYVDPLTGRMVCPNKR